MSHDVKQRLDARQDLSEEQAAWTGRQPPLPVLPRQHACMHDARPGFKLKDRTPRPECGKNIRFAGRGRLGRDFLSLSKVQPGYGLLES